MTDALAIVWKEWRELLGQRGLRGKSGVLLNVAVFGVLLPMQFGASWVASPATAAVWGWVPMYFVMTVVADAFAGERERHTLETLLASRLSDRAILFGKIGAALVYAAVVTGASLLLGLVTVNVAHAGDGLLLYSWRSALGMLSFGVLGALLVASTGVLVSLRAPTVRQAEQTLGGVIVLTMIVPFLAARWLPPAWKAALRAPEHSVALGLGLLALVAALAGGTTWIALARFRRSRLVADGTLG